MGWPGEILLLGDWEGTRKAVVAELVADLCPTAAADPTPGQIFFFYCEIQRSGCRGGGGRGTTKMLLRRRLCGCGRCF